MKKIITVLTIIILLATIIQIPASAAGNTIISFSKNTITIGDKVVVTVTINIDEPVYALDFKLKYDATKLSYPDKAGVIHENLADADGKKTFSFQYTFTSLAVGTAAISVVEPTYGTADFMSGDKTFTGASANLAIKDVELSSNANLSSITVSTGKLTPAFNANTTSYTVSVPYDTNKITITAKLSDTKAKISGGGPNLALNVGKNTFKITVTAQNGSTKSYNIFVTRAEKVVEPESTPSTPSTSESTPSTSENSSTILENPYETTISGTAYEVLTEIPNDHPFNGFTISETEFNNTQVPVLTNGDNTLSIYYLKSTETDVAAPYVLNSELETFEQLKYFVFGNYTYIFTDFPDGVGMSENYYSTYTQIGNFSVASYADTNAEMKDFVFVYCYANNKYGLYCYDTKEGTIQRYPNALLVNTSNNNKPIKDNFLTRFGSLSVNGKILLISMLIAAICLVLLFVFIIISAYKKFFNKSTDLEEIPEEFDFDDVVLVGDETADINQE